MTSNTHLEDDFEGEFKPIRQLSKEEVEEDRLVKRMRFQRKLEELEMSENQDTSKVTASGHPPVTVSSDPSSEGVLKPKVASQVGYGTKKRTISTAFSEANPFVESQPDVPKKKSSRPSKAFAKIQNMKLYNSVEGENPYIAENEGSLNHQDVTGELEDADILEMDRSMPSNPVLDSVTDNKGAAQHSALEIPQIYTEYVADESDIHTVKRQVLNQLFNASNSSILTQTPRLREKYNVVYRMFEHTIRDNEGHSTLIVGPRSSGKTLIVEEALRYAIQAYPNRFIVVRLNSLIHSDDRVALREIARQLDENAKKMSQYSSPNSESQENKSTKITGFEQRSIGDTFANILSMLDTSSSGEGGDSNEPILMPMIFIIDEFEKFTSNNKQTLLYNLFDLSQSSRSPICIVGISTRANARELLEKRVRSRFSQQIITVNKPNSIDEMWSSAKLGLSLDESFLGQLHDAEYGRLWNSYINYLYESRSQGSISNLRKVIFQNFLTTKSFKELNNSWVHAVANLNTGFPFPKDSDFKKYFAVQSQNHIQSIVSSLSTLELLLVIASARWVEKSELPVINFNLAYKEYEEMIKMLNLSSSVSSTSTSIDHRVLSNIRVNQKIWSSSVLKNCWESLYKMGLLLDSAGITTNSDGHIILNANLNKNYIIEDNKMVQLDISLDEIGSLIDESNVFKRLTKL